MKKKGLLLFSIFLLFLFIISCSLPQEQATTIAKGESVIFSPENFTLVGFWKIEQKFLLDEEKSTENNLQWVEVSVPKEKYKEFREWCGDRENNQKLLERADVIPGQTEDYGDGSSVTVYPTLSIIPSPALPSGFVPNGVCYFHRVDKTPDEGRISLLMEISLQGVVFTEDENMILVKEPEHSYNFSENRLELMTGYFEKEGDTQQKSMRTILIPSTPEAAEADGWPYDDTTR